MDIGPKRRLVVHLVAVKRPWHYTLKTGEEVTYLRLGGGMGVHKGSGALRLRLNALCCESGGELLPFYQGNVENRSTRRVDLFDCRACHIALDRALDGGRAKANRYGTLEIRRSAA